MKLIEKMARERIEAACKYNLSLGEDYPEARARAEQYVMGFLAGFRAAREMAAELAMRLRTEEWTGPIAPEIILLGESEVED